MSYIIKSTNPFVSIKLTQKGREQLAQGKLSFNYWAIGDSELNYNRESTIDSDPTYSATSQILRPVDREPNLKSFILSSQSTEPLQPLTTANLNVVKAVVNNAATERGFFYDNSGVFTTLTGSTYTPYTTTIPNTCLSGSSTLSITTTNINAGDLLLIKVSNSTLGNVTVNANDKAMPNLWYKVVSASTNTVILDRNLPNFSSQTTTSQVIVYRGGEVYNTIATGNTTAYWDTGTLSFDSANNVTCDDVPVWNMNNVWCESPAGITGTTYEDYTKFGSYSFLGQKSPYLEFTCESTTTDASANCDGIGVSYLDPVSKSISILHYTNNTISNLYGEYFYTDTANGKYLKIFIPDLMYHKANASTASGTTQGMTFIGYGTTKLIDNTDIEYIDLIEDLTMISSITPAVVGRVYPQLKLVVINDDEIVAAMSYKSNRNWTLPELSASLVSPSGGTSTGMLAVGQTIYLTYALENNYVSGLTNSMSCQKYIKVTNNTTSAKDVAFRINGTDMLPYMRKIESGYDGYGFYADTFKLLYQVVSDAAIRPDSGAWKVYDFTSTAITGTLNKTIDPKLLENQLPTANGFILDILKGNASTTYSMISALNLPANTQPNNLQFGDERFFYGNLTTYIGATIYKSIFQISAGSGYFNATTNPTRSTIASTVPPTIKDTEVGIYDSNKNLVCIGKVSTPIPLTVGTTIMLELSMDF